MTPTPADAPTTSAIFTSSRYRRPTPDNAHEARLSAAQRHSHGDGVPDMRGIFFVEQIAIGFLPRTDDRAASAGGRSAAAFVANLVQHDGSARRHAPAPGSPLVATPLLTPSSETSSVSSVCSLQTPEFFPLPSPFSKNADLPPPPSPSTYPLHPHLLPAFELPLRPIPELRQPPRSRQASAEPIPPDSGTATPTPATPVRRAAVPATPRPTVGPAPFTRPEMKQGLSQLMDDARASRISQVPLTHVVRRTTPPSRKHATRPPQA